MATQTDPENDIIGRYVDCASRLQMVIQGLAESELDLAETGGGWTIREYIHHMTDGDDIWKSFIKRALGSPQGAFMLDWYWQIPQVEWGKAWRYAEREIEPSLALLAASRAHVAQLLRANCGSLDNQMAMGMPDGNEQQVSIREIVEMQTRHIEGHTADIQRILAAHQTQKSAG